MKKSLSVIMLLLSTIVSAGEITPEQYFDLWGQNKEVYEKVEVGMTSEYQNSFISSEEGKEDIECMEHQKEIVVSTDHADKYLVYKKVTVMNDCRDQKKGEVSEELRWRKLDIYVGHVPSTRSEVTYTKITLNGSFSISEGTRTYYSDNRVEKFKRQIDHSKSQFYNLVEGVWGTDSERLLRRSITDPSSLKLEGLEINDIELRY